jgi:hypothetical protein
VPDVTSHSPDILATVEAAYRQHFEVAPARASVSFVGVEPIEILRYAGGDFESPCHHYLSLGMSRYPMTDPADVVVDAATAPRAELVLTVAGRPDDLWRQLAVLAAAPAVEGAVYVPGNRIDLSDPISAGSRCTGVVLTASELQPIAVAGVADVRVLRLQPATATELAWARVHGSEALQQRWAEAGTDLTDLARDPVALD